MLMPKTLLLNRILIALAIVFASALSQQCVADITVPRIFSDHMVLQQNSQVEVWGNAEPDQALEISFNGQTVDVTASSDGKWSGVIGTPTAGGPYQLEIKAKKDQAKIVLNDVMVGEVWICSGQSNMEWPVSKSLSPESVIQNSKKFPNVRLFSASHSATPEPLDDFAKATGWNTCGPEFVANFSAVAYHFGQNLNENLDVPIGLIDSSWGGTRCEAWTPRSALEAEDELAPLLKHWDENDNPTSRHRPSNLFNGMIAPLKGVKFRGFIWYQGEANVGRGNQYAKLFPTMIENWRKELNNADAPFLFVQLAPYRYGNRAPEALAEVWDSQLKTLLNCSNTGMVVTTDIGDVKDIHPKNKKEVGRRLALWALAKTYRAELEAKKIDVPQSYSGPIYQSMERIKDTNQIKISFEHVGESLVRRGGEELLHFSICGSDQKFVKAVAEIQDGSVVVFATEVEDPIAVRFGWSDSSEPNLFNAAGLPASPFRTDDFPLNSLDSHF